jgi:hypothetical protein
VVGQIEKALLTNPLVPDNPLAVAQGSAGADPNVLTFNLPISFQTLAGIGHAVIFVDGSEVPLQRCDAGSDGRCVLSWDTTYDPPASHFAQIAIVLNGQPWAGGIGRLGSATTPGAAPPYPYPLLPGTAEWQGAVPDDRLSSTAIPQSWQNTSTPWQLFASALANPWLRIAWVPGYKMSDSYSAAKASTLSIMSAVESSPYFGANVFRYLSSLDILAMASDDCSGFGFPRSWLDYVLACHMATLDACLNSLDQTTIRRLFEIAVWDADYFGAAGHSILPAAPARLLYAIYNRSGFAATLPPGATLPALTDDQSSQLEVGRLPIELVTPIT